MRNASEGKEVETWEIEGYTLVVEEVTTNRRRVVYRGVLVPSKALISEGIEDGEEIALDAVPRIAMLISEAEAYAMARRAATRKARFG